MRFTFLTFLGLASAAPLIQIRQEAIDYGYWLLKWESEGFATGSRVGVVANYFNLDQSISIAIDCHTTTYRGSDTVFCTPGFSYSFGAPWSGNNYATMNLTQSVELGGEEVTLYGSALLLRQSGLGAGKTSRAEGRVEAGITPL